MLSSTSHLLSLPRCYLKIPHHAALRPHGARVPLSQAPRTVRVPCKPWNASKSSLSAASFGDVKADNECPLPQSPLEMISQAQEAVKIGLKAGHTRQRLQLILPVNEKQYDFLATDAVDYPCSLQREFESCCSLVTAILEGVTGQKEFLSKRLDEGGVEGEPCAVLYPASKDFAAVVFPTSDKLGDLQSLAKVDRPLLIVNCQWNDSGQVISDFGIGPWKKAADDFLNTFKNTYLLTEQRIGSPGSIDPASGQRFVNGGVLRILLSYPGQYQAHALATDGTNQYLSSYDSRPSYKELEDLLQAAREAKLQFFDIASKASSVLSPFIADNDMDSKMESVEASSGEALRDPSNSEIDAMDVQTLRKYLTLKGLPASGRVVKLKERLKDAYKSEA